MRTGLQLIDLPPGHSAVVRTLEADSGLRQRLEAMGLRAGQTVTMLRRGQWAGPLHVRVGMTELMVRRREARGITLDR